LKNICFNDNRSKEIKMKSLTDAVYGPFATGRSALGILLLRVIVGSAFVVHGLPKIQSPFSWMGPGAPVPGFLQALAAVSEFFGGLALIFGFLTPLAALGIAFTMAFALVMVHLRSGNAWISADPSKPAYELVALYLLAVISIILTGPGAFSLDALLFGRTARRTVAQGSSLPVAQ
jgi:putative oxidoreductase